MVFGRHDEDTSRPSRAVSDRPLNDLTDAIALADGVDMSGSTLTVILNALGSDNRPTVYLSDINTVVSECGSLAWKGPITSRTAEATRSGSAIHRDFAALY